jgi:hypothetical protein
MMSQMRRFIKKRELYNNFSGLFAKRVPLTSITIRLFLQQFLNFLGEVSFSTPNKTNYSEHDKDRYQS